MRTGKNMRRNYALFLMLVLLLSLGGCSGIRFWRDDSAVVLSEAYIGPGAASMAATEPEGEDSALAIGDSLETPRFRMHFESLEIVSELVLKTGEHSSHPVYAAEDCRLLVLRGQFENRSDRSIDADAFACSATVKEGQVCDGGKLEFWHQSYFEVGPGETKGFVLYVNIPQALAAEVDVATLSLSFKNDLSRISYTYFPGEEATSDAENFYKLTGRLGGAEENAEFNDRGELSDAAAPVIRGIAPGDIVYGEGFEFTLNKIEFLQELKPADTSGYYNSFPAADGMVYLHIDAHYRNTSQEDIYTEDLPLPSADYDEGYAVYPGFVVVDDGPTQFIRSGQALVCGPGESCHYHGLIEGPAVMAGGEEALYVLLPMAGGVTYRCDIR